MLKNLLTTTFLLLISLAHPFPVNAEVSKWVPNGAAVSTFDNGYSFKYFPAITGAGNDKAFIVWEDPRDNPFTGVADIYVQKLDANGTPIFKNNSGIIADKKVTVDGTADKRFPSITKDGSGNAFVVWEDYREGDNNIDIYVQKIDGNGVPLWESSKIICDYSGNQRFPQIILSKNTSPVDVEAIVVWEDYRNSTYSQIYAQKIDENGVRDPNWTSNGILIASTTTNQYSPAITSDGSGGAILVWADWRNIPGTSSTGIDIYGQRIASNGTAQWSSDKMVITNATEDQMFPAITGDGLGNYVITWEDYRTDIYTSDIYAKRINGNNTLQSTDQLISSATATGNIAADQRYPRLAYSTEDNGFIILWEDYRNDPVEYNADIYAQKITNGGSILWAEDGVQVAKIDGTTQDAVAAASLDTKGIIATWEDYRSNSVYDIYATPLPIPGSISIAGGASNTVSSTVTLNLWASSFGEGPLEMRFSNDGSTWSAWEPYFTTRPSNWYLTGNPGTNTVYAQFRDSSTPTQVSPVYSDDITLINMTINSGAEYTINQNVTLNLSANAALMRFCNDDTATCTWSDWETYAATRTNWPLSDGNSPKTVFVQFKDAFGVESAISYDSIIFDSIPPNIDSTYPINSASSVSLNPSITITFDEAIDASTITTGSTGNINLKQGSTIIDSTLSYSTVTYTVTLTPNNKLSINSPYTVDITGVKDIAGNSISPYSFSFTTISDNAPPTGTLKINSDAVYTNNLTVTLTISSPDSDVSQMRFSADGSSWRDGWKGYDTSASFDDISSSGGTKRVYVQFMDSVGNISDPLAYFDDIILDMTLPTGTISINSGAAYTNSASVTLTLSCNDTNGCSQMEFSNDNSTWSTAESYAASKAWVLAGGDGTKTVYVKFKDNAGNWSDAYSAAIILDTTLPTGTISINSGAAYTNSTSVTLTLSCTDTNGCSQMQLSNDNSTWSTAESYAASKEWVLADGDGTKTVYVKLKDNAGNWSDASSATIILDSTAPGPGSGVTPSILLDGAMITSGQAYYSFSKIVASWTSLSDTSAGLQEYRIAIGTTAGGTDILDWAGTAVPSYTTGDISSDHFGKTLYISIKAIDNLGTESSILSASFVYTPADINSKAGGGDGRVDGFDLGKLGIAYNPFGSVPSEYEAADINKDGTVGNEDLFILGVNFGKVRE